MSERVWKIDDAGDLVLYEGERRVRLAAALMPDDRAELRPILERGQATEELPEGVHRAPDGTLLCQGIDLPESWGFYGPPESIGASEDESRPWWDWRDRETDVRTGHVWYEVRPVQPATERVEAWEALRDRRVVLIPGGTNHLDLSGEDRTEQQRIGALACSGAVGADGLVEVLVEP